MEFSNYLELILSRSASEMRITAAYQVYIKKERKKKPVGVENERIFSCSDEPQAGLATITVDVQSG